jgi:hypothetical protein
MTIPRDLVLRTLQCDSCLDKRQSLRQEQQA